MIYRLLYQVILGVCNGGTTTLTASGGTSYKWSNGTSGATVTVGAGTYTVTVTSGSCTATRSVTVTSNSLDATISGNTSVCNGGTTTLTASGGRIVPMEQWHKWCNGNSRRGYLYRNGNKWFMHGYSLSNGDFKQLERCYRSEYKRRSMANDE